MNSVMNGIKRTSMKLGQVVVTACVREILREKDISAAINRHISGDWGEVSEADRKMNDNALNHGGRILSAYTSAGGDKFWIITEADGSYTTILLPSDY